MSTYLFNMLCDEMKACLAPPPPTEDTAYCKENSFTQGIVVELISFSWINIFNERMTDRLTIWQFRLAYFVHMFLKTNEVSLSRKH